MRPMIVLGLRGVGKTVICTEVVRKATAYQLVQIGDFVRKYVGPDSQQLGDRYFVAMKEFVKHVRAVRRHKTVLIESGDFVMRVSGLFRCAHFHPWESVDPGSITVIVASPTAILARREKNSTKARGVASETEQTVQLEQDLLVSFASATANRLRIPFNAVLNERRIQQAAEDLVRALSCSEKEYRVVAKLRRNI